MGAVGEILAAAGQHAGRITRADLDWLQERLLRAQSAESVRLDGLKEDRRPVIGGGISVLRAVFDLLQIDTLQVAQGALRQGALYSLVEREQPSPGALGRRGVIARRVGHAPAVIGGVNLDLRLRSRRGGRLA